ncbi:MULTISPECIES: hypothetical protein [unclassified Bradyrhizobium]|uniref:hypothetical protein n=1 Tax=unclassified Bradyrhizobium TaxID=2631580 RepID=UPI002915E0F4|nr:MULTISPECIES: hypothetical protein [unclassified Bradyrhizobium]
MIAFYNVCRVALIIYLFWAMQSLGDLALSMFYPAHRYRWSTADRLCADVFVGVGIGHLILLIVGFLQLYFSLVALVLTFPLVWRSWRDIVAVSAEARRAIEDQFRSSLLKAIVAGLCFSLFAMAALLLLLVKGLFPAGGHDYFLHYFPYYEAVIRHHGIWPNEVWYHYFYSKGNGITFLAMLLSDALAPQLVTYCLILTSGIALMRMIRQMCPTSLWIYVIPALYLGIFIYTPGVAEFAANGGWGDFEKQHELVVALSVAILWCLGNSLEDGRGYRSPWFFAAASATVASVIVERTYAYYIGLVFVLVAIGFFVGRRWRNVATCLGMAVVAGVTLLSLYAVNYLITGLVDDQIMLLTWNITDVEKLYRWGDLLLAIIVHWSLTGLAANSVPLNLDTLRFVVLSLRLELLYPLVAAGVVGAILALVFRRARLREPSMLLLLAAAFIAFLILTVVAGRAQAISFYRYASFVVPIVLALSVSLASLLVVSSQWRFLDLAYRCVLPVGVLAACVYCAQLAYPSGRFSAVLQQARSFALGRISIDEAYVGQTSWPGRMPFGAIYPGARGAYQAVGRGVPIWTFHVHSYCMLPDCDFRTHAPFIMSRDIDRLLYGTPEEGKAVLQAAGLNYFFFSRELQVADFAIGASLFRPDTVGQYLGVKWTDGNSVLLTWREGDTKPLEGEMLKSYGEAIENSIVVKSFPWRAMDAIFDRLRRQPHPWRSFPLPWEGNRPY